MVDRKKMRCPKCPGWLYRHKYGWGHIYSLAHTVAGFPGGYCDYSKKEEV